MLLKKFTAGWKTRKHQPVKQTVLGVFWCPLAGEPSATERDVARKGDVSDTGQISDRGLCSTWRGKELESREKPHCRNRNTFLLLKPFDSIRAVSVAASPPPCHTGPGGLGKAGDSQTE